MIEPDRPRRDPALAAVIDKPGGKLAGKSTLNRLPRRSIGTRHHTLGHDPATLERLNAYTGWFPHKVA
jgi:hypothetical protein